MRRGFTMIELIFVIVVIALLARISIGKLSATRDDAKLSATVSNMSICIIDASAHYTATGIDFTDAVHSTACDENNTVCYDIVYAINGKDFNVSTDPTGNGMYSFCTDIEYVGGHLAKIYNFGGQSVKR